MRLRLRELPLLGVAILFSVKDLPFPLIMKLVMFTQKENEYLKKNMNTIC